MEVDNYCTNETGSKRGVTIRDDYWEEQVEGTYCWLQKRWQDISLNYIRESISDASIGEYPYYYGGTKETWSGSSEYYSFNWKCPLSSGTYEETLTVSGTALSEYPSGYDYNYFISELNFLYYTEDNSFSCSRDLLSFNIFNEPHFGDKSCSGYESRSGFRLNGEEVYLDSDDYRGSSSAANITVDLCSVVRIARLDKENYYGVYDFSLVVLNDFMDIFNKYRESYTHNDASFMQPLRPYASKPVILPLPQ